MAEGAEGTWMAEEEVTGMKFKSCINVFYMFLHLNSRGFRIAYN